MKITRKTVAEKLIAYLYHRIMKEHYLVIIEKGAKNFSAYSPDISRKVRICGIRFSGLRSGFE